MSSVAKVNMGYRAHSTSSGVLNGHKFLSSFIQSSLKEIILRNYLPAKIQVKCTFYEVTELLLKTMSDRFIGSKNWPLRLQIYLTKDQILSCSPSLLSCLLARYF